MPRGEAVATGPCARRALGRADSQSLGAFIRALGRHLIQAGTPDIPAPGYRRGGRERPLPAQGAAVLAKDGAQGREVPARGGRGSPGSGGGRWAS